MPLDPSIALQNDPQLALKANTNPVDFATNMQNSQEFAMNQQKMANTEQDRQRQYALSQAEQAKAADISKIYKLADTSTPEGRAKLHQQLYMVDPGTAQAQEKSDVDLKYKQKQTEESDVKIHKMLVYMDGQKFDQMKAQQNKYNTAIENLQELEKKTTNPVIKEQQYQATRATLLNDPTIPDDIKKGLPVKYDANFIASVAIQAEDSQKRIHDAEKDRLEAAKAAAEGKQVVTGVDANGKSVIDVVNKSTGEVIETGVGMAQKGGGGGAANAKIDRDNTTLIREGSDVADSLKAIKNVQFTTPELVHETKEGVHGIFNSVINEPTINVLQKKLSDEDATNLNSLQAGMAANIARMQSIGSGRGATQSQIDVIQKADMISTGDTIGNARFKMATVARHVRNSLAGIDPTRLNEEQKKVLAQINEIIADVPDPSTMWKNGKPKNEASSMVASKKDKLTSIFGTGTQKPALDDIFK